MSSCDLAHFSALVLVTVVVNLASAGRLEAAVPKPIILDTDICDDIDDTWAIATVLRSVELDCKLIVTAVGNTEAKARVVAKFLQRAGRADIPVGVGVKQGDGWHRQVAWAQDYELSSYPGKVHKDGVQAIIDTIMDSPTRITLIGIGPLTNVAEALKREPRIAEKADFIGMQGSIYRGYGSDKPDAEYNVKQDVEAAKRIFTAPWPMTMTPLDTCGLVALDGEKYQEVVKSEDPIATALIENYRIWYKDGLRDRKDLDGAGMGRLVDEKLSSSSTTLFDTVAIYLAISRALVDMRRLPIRVSDDGFTQVEEGAKLVDCAVKWKDLDGYRSWLVDRLTR
jgi:pyrimidine-specific ribonucleoside hydrolase